ncbi:MAG TPA: hypothetical protein PK413_18245, partial [Thermoanaerobaculia bacterium]|nr:hypothetical protein [Thermoanaerobaculia bacterium]
HVFREGDPFTAIAAVRAGTVKTYVVDPSGHEQVLGFAAKVGAIHAGLECGLIGERIPGMDMISFGPTIQFPHSPDERVEIATVPRFYHLLKATLTELAG